ncbi:DUF5675 family protein [Shivajiella indica]|uniref:DUF5675 family protein n=1 Tax=Shivajiella indica TaxID=872115 RepID=A0ABW5BAF1_9BACT
MKLQLIRWYGKKETRALLLKDNKILCKTLEPSLTAAYPVPVCIPEGVYTFKLEYGEEIGWYILLIGADQSIKGQMLPLKGGMKTGEYTLSPVTSYRESGRFSKLAFLKLMDRLSEWISQGEEISLEISSAKTSMRKEQWYSQKVLSD